MKDIENYKLPLVQAALQRLDGALTRLETAVANAGTGKPDPEIEKKFKQLSEAHGTLKLTAGRVAQHCHQVVHAQVAGLGEEGPAHCLLGRQAADDRAAKRCSAARRGR